MLGSRGSRIWDSSLAPRRLKKTRIPLVAGGEDRRFGGKTRAMASLFPDDYYFDCRNMMQAQRSNSKPPWQSHASLPILG